MSRPGAGWTGPITLPTARTSRAGGVAEKLRVGIVGLGQIAWAIDEDPYRDTLWSHAEAYRRHNSTEIVAVCDIDRSRMTAFEGKYGPVRCHSDVAGMLSASELDVVSVCVPTAAHEEVVAEIVSRSSARAIFCEKPMGWDEDMARRIARLCERSGRVIVVNYMRRWDCHYVAIKQIVDAGTFGALTAITAYGATALLTSASHLIDLLLMYGGTPAWVSGDLQTDYVRRVNGVDDPGGAAFIKFAGGAHGFLKATSASPQHYMFDLDLLFADGRIVIGDDGRTCRQWRFIDTPTSTGLGYKTLSEVPVEHRLGRPRLLAAIDDVIACFDSPKQPASNASNAVDVHRIISLIKESSSHGGSAVRF